MFVVVGFQSPLQFGARETVGNGGKPTKEVIGDRREEKSEEKSEEKRSLKK